MGRSCGRLFFEARSSGLLLVHVPQYVFTGRHLNGLEHYMAPLMLHYNS